MIPFRINIDINTTSNKTANVQAMVLRENKTHRIVFIPKIVDKNDDWADSVSGCFIAQRKGTNESWNDIEGISLSNLKKGEWTKFEITSKEILNMLNYTDELRKMCMEEKSFYRIQNKQVLILDKNIDKEEIADLINLMDSDSEKISLIKDILSNSTNWNEILDYIYDSKNRNKLIDALSNVDNSKKNEIVNQLSIERMNPQVIIDNIDNKNESYWQNLFKSNPQFISCVIPSMMHFITDQAFIGGKNIDNRNSSITDFIFKNNIDNVAIVEIKNPCEKLIGGEYRDNVYRPSKELTGAIVQVNNQRDTFLKHYYPIKGLSEESGINFTAVMPKSYLIIGSTQLLNAAQKKSLDLYRNELRNVEILTFDEVYNKLKIVYDILKGDSND